MKKILIINGHPDKESFCQAISQAYQRGVQKSQAESKLINLIDLKFSLILKYGYRIRSELEPDLLLLRDYIKESDHIVFIYPIWWGTYPALMKGFFDRVFLPGFCFKFKKNRFMWDKLLKGKTGRIIATMNTPKIFHIFIYHNIGILSVKKVIMKFCGIKPVKTTVFSKVEKAKKETREKWLSKVEKLGEKNI